MNWPHDPKSWLEFPLECLWYLLPGAVFHIVALIAGIAGFSVGRLLGWRLPRFSTLVIFQSYLLLASMIVNGFWSCTVWGSLYWSVDYTADFSVFMPITRGQIDYSWSPEIVGGLNGVTLTQLNLVWALFALSAWIIALLATRWTISRRRNRIGEQAVGCNRRSASSLKSERCAAVHPL